jgi:prophage DNA circulation protein
MAPPPYKNRLRPASFRGAQFHIEAGGKTSGRRTVLHEYPKRDDPYAEDMGRRARRWTVQGYVIGGNAQAFDFDYTQARDALIAACETEGSGLLVHPTMGEMIVNCETYTCAESRTRGNLAEIDMVFVEAGTAPNTATGAATQSIVQNQADNLGQAAADSLDSSLAQQLADGVNSV